MIGMIATALGSPRRFRDRAGAGGAACGSARLRGPPAAVRAAAPPAPRRTARLSGGACAYRPPPVYRPARAWSSSTRAATGRPAAAVRRRGCHRLHRRGRRRCRSPAPPRSPAIAGITPTPAKTTRLLGRLPLTSKQSGRGGGGAHFLEPFLLRAPRRARWSVQGPQPSWKPIFSCASRSSTDQWSTPRRIARPAVLVGEGDDEPS